MMSTLKKKEEMYEKNVKKYKKKQEISVSFVERFKECNYLTERH